MTETERFAAQVAQWQQWLEQSTCEHRVRTAEGWQRLFDVHPQAAPVHLALACEPPSSAVQVLFVRAGGHDLADHPDVALVSAVRTELELTPPAAYHHLAHPDAQVVVKITPSGILMRSWTDV